jgi:hypothetical protein
MPTRRFAQIAAVCSSIVLVSGYLLYRVNAGDGGAAKVISSSKSGRVAPDSTEQTSTTAPAEIGLPLAATEPAVLLPGSKSAPVLDQSMVRDGPLIMTPPSATQRSASPAPSTKPSDSFKLK